MAESTPTGLIRATDVAQQTQPGRAANGIHYAAFGETAIAPPDLERIVQAVPVPVAAALTRKVYYFVPLALAETHAAPAPGAGHRTTRDETMIAPAYSAELADQAICHRNVELEAAADAPNEAVFISTRLLSDRFSLAFEFFINVGHAFVDTAGVPASFGELAWNQALADVRGETSQDAWETRGLALNGGDGPAGKPEVSFGSKPRVDERSRNDFLEASFADAVAIYLLSLATDFDYSELREREYPLLAPAALADRLRLVAGLFPANAGYEFAIRYRRRM